MEIYSRVMFFFFMERCNWDYIFAHFLPTFASFLIRFAQQLLKNVTSVTSVQETQVVT